MYDGMAELPLFNPDLEDADINPVKDYRRQLQSCDGVLISSPEYAHGVPGALKNALDWVVGTGELVDKPVALLNTSSRSVYAAASLRETVTVMSARLIDEASITIPLLGKDLDEAQVAADPELSRLIRSALAAFANAIGSRDGGREQ